MPVVSSKPF